MPDFTPIRKLLALRQLAPFANVDLAELAVIADNVREVRFAAGDEVVAADARPPAVHFILDGMIEARRGTGIETWGPRNVFGVLEVLAGRSLDAPAIAAVETHTLELRATDAIEILEDNFGVLRAVLRGLAERLVGAGVRTARPAIEVPPHRLTLVERVIVLRQQRPFAASRLQAVAAVAHGCEEIVLPPGTIVAHADQVADTLTIILEGEVRRGAQVLRPGDSIGALEALAGARYTASAETASSVRAIRCTAATILDVVEDHGDLGLAIVGNLARALLDLRGPPEVEHEMQPYLS